MGSRAAAERLLAQKGVLVDGASRAKSYRLEGGEEVAFEALEAPQGLEPEQRVYIVLSDTPAFAWSNSPTW